MNKYIAEFIGTFFLVLTVGCTVVGAIPGVIPPLAIGAGLWSWSTPAVTFRAGIIIRR